MERKHTAGETLTGSGKDSLVPWKGLVNTNTCFYTIALDFVNPFPESESAIFAMQVHTNKEYTVA